MDNKVIIVSLKGPFWDNFAIANKEGKIPILDLIVFMNYSDILTPGRLEYLIRVVQHRGLSNFLGLL